MSSVQSFWPVDLCRCFKSRAVGSAAGLGGIVSGRVYVFDSAGVFKQQLGQCSCLLYAACAALLAVSGVANYQQDALM
jgi:hypothetical protein